MKNINLSPDESFILLCCCIEADAERKKRIEELLATGGLDWNYILYCAERHGVANLIYNCVLNIENKNAIPDAVLKKLKNYYYTAAYNNLIALKEFNEILAAFSMAGIRTIPLKGIDLLRTIYPNIALRVLSDVDVLVKKADLNRAVQQLERMGYSKEKAAHRIEELFHLVYSRKENKTKIFVEVHWDVDIPKSPYHINIADLWARAETVMIEKHEYCRLSLEDGIIFNTFHMLRSPLTPGSALVISLKNLCDVAEIIKINSGMINWESIFSRAKQYNIVRPLYLIFLLLQELFNSSIPKDLFGEVTRAGFTDEMIGQLIEEWIFVKNSDPIFLPGTIGAAVSQEKITKKINPLSVFKTIYIVVRHQIKTAPSLVIGSKITFRKLGKSLGNYLKLFWFLIRDFKTADMLITSQLLKTKKLEKIEKWIQNNS